MATEQQGKKEPDRYALNGSMRRKGGGREGEGVGSFCCRLSLLSRVPDLKSPVTKLLPLSLAEKDFTGKTGHRERFTNFFTVSEFLLLV